MARNESDREDLYAEATAFVRRIELISRATADGESTVVAGYRRNGILTIYLSSDEMYQFTSDGELRRALACDALFRTQGHTLARLVRHRTPAATELLRYDLSEGELSQFLDAATERLQSLLSGLVEEEFRVARREPADVDVLADLQRSLHAILASPLRIAPALPTKRK